MPRLLDGTGQVIDDLAPQLVGADEFRAGQSTALRVDGDAEVGDLPAGWQQAELLAINFPNFADGRGLSLAVLLRSQHGFAGRLRAEGDVTLDLLHYLRRCGFDEFALRDDQDLASCQAALARARLYYQGSLTDPVPVFRRAAG